MKTFGGCVTFYGIGGAKLDPEVEAFLLKAKFPYAIGRDLQRPLRCSDMLCTDGEGLALWDIRSIM